MPTEGDVLNQRYQILRMLSDRGGMGVIYLATDRNLGDTVVVKQSRFSSAESLREKEHYRGLTEAELQSEVASLQQAFEREAKLLRRLRHDALPRVLDYFKTADGDQFLVMEFIPGEDFGELLDKRQRQQQGPFPFAHVLGWAEQILDALAYLHTQFDPPVIHRDIKPQNLKLMPGGRVVLLDFGMAKGAPSGISVPHASVLGSSPVYSPLEQIEDQGTDVRSDLYTVAVTLYHLLTGQKPPGAGTRAMSLLGRRPDPLRPAHELNPQIPPAVSVVLQRAAELHQDDRYPSAAAMREALRQAVTAAPPPVVLPAPPPELKPSMRATPAGAEIRQRIVVSLDSGSQRSKLVVEARPAPPQVFTEDLDKGLKLELVHLPGGAFQMGSNDYENEQPIHRVTLSPFFIGRYPITQAQWQAVMGNNPSHFKGADLPVESVKWEDAVKFCQRLAQRTSHQYRLPTEAEWEYACRAGSMGKWCFGDAESLLEQYAWYYKNSGKKTHSVGQKKPNQFGLYDMHGNVWEWCQDWYADEYYSKSPEHDPQGPAKGDHRVLRGGSWGYYQRDCRSANRYGYAPGFANINYGLRVVCVARAS